MTDKVTSILQKHVSEFGFLNIEDYKSKRSAFKSNNRYNDYSFLDGYKSIITLAFPYPRKEEKWLGKGYGIFARFSYGLDYHTVIGEILLKIEKDLNELGISSYGSVDISRVDEKLAGYLSGIGYFGKNHILINKNYGSYLFLATILVDVNLDNKLSIVENECGDCNLCITSCPSGALDNGFDKNKCISNLSQTKMAFNEEEVSYFKTTIYGCDICQKVCPKNTGIDFHKIAGFEPTGIENVELSSLLKMTKRDFKETYGNNTSHWIGVTTMKRNALCLIANQKLTHFKPQILESMAAYKDVLWYNKTAEVVLKILERE